MMAARCADETGACPSRSRYFHATNLIPKRRTQPDLPRPALGAYQPGRHRADLIAPALRLAPLDQRQGVQYRHTLAPQAVGTQPVAVSAVVGEGIEALAAHAPDGTERERWSIQFATIPQQPHCVVGNALPVNRLRGILVVFALLLGSDESGVHAMLVYKLARSHPGAVIVFIV